MDLRGPKLWSTTTAVCAKVRRARPLTLVGGDLTSVPLDLTLVPGRPKCGGPATKVWSLRHRTSVALRPHFGRARPECDDVQAQYGALCAAPGRRRAQGDDREVRRFGLCRLNGSWLDGGGERHGAGFAQEWWRAPLRAHEGEGSSVESGSDSGSDSGSNGSSSRSSSSRSSSSDGRGAASGEKTIWAGERGQHD